MNIEEKLKEAEKNYKILNNEFETFLDLIPGILFCKDRNDVVTRVNQNFADLLNLKKGDIIGKTTFDLFPKDQAENFRKDDLEVINTGKPKLNIEEVADFPDKKVWSTTSKVPYYNDKGEINGIIGLAIDITERKIAEQKLEDSEKQLRKLNDELETKVIARTEALKSSEQRCKTILDSIVTGVWVADKEDNIYYANKGMGKIAGIPSEQLVNTNILNDFSESTLKYFKPYYLKARKTLKEVYYDSIPVITPAGRQSYQSGWLIPLTKDGKFYNTICTVEDITERKKTEQNLKESEKKLRNLNKELEQKVEDRTKKLQESEAILRSTLESTADGILVVDEDGHVTRTNSKFADMWRIPQDLIAERDDQKLIIYVLSQLINPEAFISKVNQLYKSVSESFDTLIFKDARVFERFSSPLIHAGEIKGRVWSFRDVTKQKISEQKLKESEQRLTSFMNSATDGFVLYDARLNYIDVNNIASQIIGMTKEEIIGKNILDIVPNLKETGRYDKYLDVIKTGEPFSTEEGTMNRRDGQSSYQLSVRAFKVGDNLGIIFTDITEIKRVELKLREKNIELSVLNKIITLGNESTSLQEFLEKSYDQVLEVVNFDRGGVYLYDPEIHHNKLVLHKNTHPDFIAAVEDVDMSVEPFNIIFDKNKPYYIEDFSKFMEGSKDLGIYSAAIVPLRSKDEYIGSMNVGSNRYQILSQKDLEILVAIGKQMGIIIQKFESEKLLKESEQRLTSFMNSATDGFVLYDAKLNYIDVNNVAIQTIGKTKEEIIGKNILDIVPNLKETGRYDKYLDVIKTGEPFSTEEGTINRRDGSLSSNLSIRAFKVGDNLGIIFTDITERKEKEKEIFDLAQFPSENPYSVLRVNRNGVMYINKAGKKLLNIEDNSQIPKIFQRDVKEAFESNQKTITEVELDERVYSFIITPIKDTDYVNIYGMDITEKNQVAVKLRELNKLKTDFLRRASHELKTPLITIKGFSELILSVHKDQLDPSINAKLREINAGCERLQNIIESLLKTSRLESPELRPSKHREDLSFLINVCLHELEPMAERRRQSINLDIHNQLHVTIEKEEIHDVLSNLLSNAIKYTPPMGKIYIRTELKEDFVVVSVRDNGIGFTDEQKKLIFQQFGKIERYGQGLDLGIEGTGLGLYISKKIVESHGGKIWMESEGKNRGTIFYFSLPRIIEE